MKRGNARGAQLAAILLLAAASAGCASEVPRRHEVVIRGFAYVPAELELSEGDTVVWINQDVVPHTATAEDQGWDTGEIPAGESREIVVGGSAAQAYVCTFHPNMRAALVVAR